LSAVHATYGSRLQILLYPSDEFGGQELPSERVPAFVRAQGLPTDSDTCLLMAKVNVNGRSADPAWQHAKATFPGDIKWNFAGIFVFDAAGDCVGRFTSRDIDSVEKCLHGLLP
jgi:glutathione peroxidase-family protein